MMIRLTCDKCQSDVDVQPYYYDCYITTRTWYDTNEAEYTAIARGKALCPCCGAVIREESRHTLTKGDIIELSQRSNLKI